MAEQSAASLPDPEAQDARKRITRQGLGQMAGIFRFLLPYRWQFALGMAFLFLSALTTLAFPLFLGELVNAAVPGFRAGEAGLPNFSPISAPQGDFLAGLDVNQIALLLVGVLVLQGVFGFLRVYLFAQVSERTMADIRAAVYRRLITLRFSFFEQRRVGELTSRLSSDVTQLSDILSYTLAEFIRQLLTLTVGMGLMVTLISAKLTLFMLAIFPAVIVAALVFGRYIRKLSKQTQDELAASGSIVEETFQSIQAVKAFANEWYEARRYRQSLDRVVSTALKAAVWRGLFITFIFVALFGVIILVIWFGARMIQAGEIAVGDLISFILYTAFIGGSVAGMGDLYGQLQKTIGASERLREILDESPEFELADSELPAPRVQGELRMEDLHFAYPARPEIEVLKGVSLHVAPGEQVALVGQSGAGKSTLVQLLLRFHEASGGSIFLDGQPLASYPLPMLRKNIGIVPQDVTLFGGSIRENIAYGRPGASDEEIIEAARRAYAWEFIETFPEQLSTLVGERGVKLSGGQRQRIAIARAILKDPSILILDEATSSLDAESERIVQAALNELMKGRTTLIIAHRLSTIRNADRIYVLEEGRVSEAGSHDELSARPDGLYQHLLRLQAVS